MFTPLWILLSLLWCLACSLAAVGGGYLAGTVLGALLYDDDNPRHYGPLLARIAKVYCYLRYRLRQPQHKEE